MKVGVPTEIKTDEYRVSLTPAGVRELTDHGPRRARAAGGGRGLARSSTPTTRRRARGSLPDAEAVFGEAEMVLEVKEPQPQEVAMLRPEQTLFTYLHLAPDPELTKSLCESGATCVAYETVEDSKGRLPLLAPMSEVAGKIATQAGAFMLEKPLGGRGVLLGGVPGVAAANVMVIGGGVVGFNAASIAIGMEADVFVFDRNIDRLRELDVAFAGRASTVYSSTLAIEEMLPRADLVIGAVLVHGARAPYVITREQLGLMKLERAVLVDVSIDQGGCFETSRPTTHSDPTFEVDGITHYCVANMPGAVPITSTYALTNATLPYVLALADSGVEEAISRDPGLRPGRERRRRARSRTRPSPRARDSIARRSDEVVSRSSRQSSADSRRERWLQPRRPELQNFIDGEFVDPADGATEEVLNPATGELIADGAAVGRGGREPCRGRPRRARSEGWAATTPGERALALLELADAIEENARRDRRPRGRRTPASRSRRSSTRRSRSWSTTCASSRAPRAAWRAVLAAST